HQLGFLRSGRRPAWTSKRTPATKQDHSGGPDCNRLKSLDPVSGSSLQRSCLAKQLDEYLYVPEDYVVPAELSRPARALGAWCGRKHQFTAELYHPLVKGRRMPWQRRA